MGIRLFQEPKLEDPVLIAGWPGIGNIGLIAVDTLRRAVEAEEFGEIEPWDFFYPKKLVVRGGELKDLEFPTSQFYFKKTRGQDLMFLVGEEQSTEGGKVYAEGPKAYQLANLVLDVALQFGCRRVYTSGAAPAPIHHTARPRVWAVPNSEGLLKEVRSYENTLLMSDIEGTGGLGNIAGLNGLLLGVARRRGVEAICLMGEIPVYLRGLPFPYPKASQSVLEVLTAALGLRVHLPELEALVERSEREIEALYEEFPPAIREQLEKLRAGTDARPTEAGPITEEDKKRILKDIDRFFRKGSKGNQD